MTSTPFDLPNFTIRRKVLKIFGASFHIYDPSGAVVGFCKQKAFKLKEDIRLYKDESMDAELLTIHARNIVDFSAAYDVIDAETGSKVGALRRKGLTSILRDSWEVLDTEDRPIAKLQEDSGGMALLRRFLSNLIPQTFFVKDNAGRQVARLKQRFNPFVYRLEVSILPGNEFAPQLIWGAAVLVAAIEGRQS